MLEYDGFRITVLRVTKSSYKATALYISTHRTRVYLNQTEWSEIKRRVADWNELPGAKPRAATQCQACEGAHCAVCLGEWLQPITGGGRAREITITREMTGWQAHPIISRCRQTNRHTVGSICSTHARSHARTIAWKPPSLWSAGRFLCDSCPDPVPIVGWDWTRELLGWDALRVNCSVKSLQPTFKVRYVSGRVAIGWYLPILSITQMGREFTFSLGWATRKESYVRVKSV